MSETFCTRHHDYIEINAPAFIQSLQTELRYEHDTLYIEDVSVNTLAQTYGTPCYVYSKKAILAAYQNYTDSFASIDHQICYAVKANSNIAILNILAQAGAGFDIVSRGELVRVLAAGGDAKKVIYSGVGKTTEDIQFALEKGIGCFNVESIEELRLIDQIAQSLNTKAPISIRVNPNIDAGTHPYISTGLKENKFGIAHEQAIEAYEYAASLDGLHILGIDCHIGSQLTDISPFAAALDKLIELIDILKTKGIEFSHIDLGGGLGVQYIDENPASLQEFAALLLPKLTELNLKLLLEPGRNIVANAGILLTNVNILKKGENKNFAIVDAAMNDFIRPALYQAELAMIPATLSNQLSHDELKVWDIVGPVCESGDFLAKNRKLSLATGDTLVCTGVGAYGFSMSSNYNSRPRVAEVMVSDDKHQLIRKRESYEQLYENEQLWKL